MAGIPLLDLKAQLAPLRGEILSGIEEVLESGAYVLGPHVKAFEAEIAKYCGTKYAVGCASGTDALLLALMARNIGPGDEVICPTYTFFATAGVIHRLGATPVFVDVDPEHYNMSVEGFKAAITDKTKAVIPVYLFGQVAAMNEINVIAKEHKLTVVEDAAQALGAKYHGKMSGNLGDFGCFSFYPTKNLGGYGDGGVITTNSDEDYDLLTKLRVHGARPKYIHGLVGVNSRLDAIQAAILGVKLPHLDSWADARRTHADYYRGLFKGTGVKTPSEAEGCHHIYNQFVIQIPNRDEVMAALKDAQIGCEIYYPLSMHEQECFKYLGYKTGDLPVAERAAKETLSIPVFPELTNEQMDTVAATVLKTAKVSA